MTTRPSPVALVLAGGLLAITPGRWHFVAGTVARATFRARAVYARSWIRRWRRIRVVG